MIKLFTPNNSKPWTGNFAIACSGGFDSMAVAHFFIKGKRKPTILHVNHSTGNDAAEAEVLHFCTQNELKMFTYKVNPADKLKKESWEEFWRNERIKAFRTVDMPVITGHNLDDAMETWMFGAMHGQPKLIPYNTNNVYRPFLLTPKDDLRNYCIKHKISWNEDKSNKDNKYARNRIRNNIMPEVLKINAGFPTVVARKYREMYEKS
jgi:tRNA(Ile)-lysidine synthase